MTVSGRILLLWYFSSQALRNPSASATAVRAYRAAERIKSAWLRRAASVTMPIQWPPGVIFFVPNIACPCTCIT